MPVSVRRAAMASRSLRRCPTAVTPSSFRVLVRQARKNGLVYLVLAECSLILPEAQAPQPNHDVHDGAPTIGGGTHHVPAQSECPGRALALGTLTPSSARTDRTIFVLRYAANIAKTGTLARLESRQALDGVRIEAATALNGRPSRSPFTSGIAADSGLKTPTTGTGGYCARTASGHTADMPPISVMNSRRLIRSLRRPSAPLHRTPTSVMNSRRFIRSPRRRQ